MRIPSTQKFYGFHECLLHPPSINSLVWSSDGYTQALSKALSEEELIYLRAQFMLLEPSEDGRVSLENFKKVVKHNLPALNI